MERPDSPQFSCIDLFCGCGGNSWGMLQKETSRPLTPLLALDNDPVALATYHWNMPAVEAVLADIRQMSPNTILERIGIQPGELGCLIASPPCQTYSRNNRRPKDEQDDRETLYQPILKMIKVIQPWVVFMENVPEMKTHRNGIHHSLFLKQLEELGYKIGHWIVDAANYGVPQHRTRLIYLAYRKKMRITPRYPVPTHSDTPGLRSWVSVEDAIADLPPRQAGDEETWSEEDATYDHPLSMYALARRRSRPAVVYNHFARALNEIQLQRLHALKEGQAYYDLPNELRPTAGYKNSYGRLWRDKPSPTLTTFLLYPGSGRFSHYEQDRVITIREALRLQSFDDSFRVLGIPIEQSRQVGNAVPPLLAAAFKNVIIADLETFFGQEIPPLARIEKAARA